MPIIRIVKMIFRKEEIERFERIFSERKDIIRNFPGCRHLEIWQHEKEKNIFFTYSIWQNEEYLDRYRFSPFFKETWELTRSLFSEKAEAWTVREVGSRESGAGL
jgi:quinol monooxygenase YgiN